MADAAVISGTKRLPSLHWGRGLERENCGTFTLSWSNICWQEVAVQFWLVCLFARSKQMEWKQISVRRQNWIQRKDVNFVWRCSFRRVGDELAPNQILQGRYVTRPEGELYYQSRVSYFTTNLNHAKIPQLLRVWYYVKKTHRLFILIKITCAIKVLETKHQEQKYSRRSRNKLLMRQSAPATGIDKSGSSDRPS